MMKKLLQDFPVAGHHADLTVTKNLPIQALAFRAPEHHTADMTMEMMVLPIQASGFPVLERHTADIITERMVRPIQASDSPVPGHHTANTTTERMVRMATPRFEITPAGRRGKPAELTDTRWNFLSDHETIVGSEPRYRDQHAGLLKLGVTT